ncbi:hypothetical protein [Agromyces sp. NPDC057865]|uniref:hypothetical protein n=1 Tax=Agromyces sp. NPDC057865 TaxID=3346267 RepID=UPI00366C3051
MDVVAERSEVERILEDPAYVVPEADAASNGPGDRFRASASRFVNGATHAARRHRLDVLLAGIDVDELSLDAAARTRAMLPAAIDEIAAQVPVACLAARLGFADPDAAPAWVAALAAHYPTGGPSSSADAAATRLIAAADDVRGGLDGDLDGDAELRVQLLVQAHAATAGLIAAAVRLPAARDGGVPTADLLAAVLRDALPVRQTKRLAPDGEVLVLRLDGADHGSPHDPRTLAFGAGPRACPAVRHAIAIATAVVDEVRAC